MWLKDLGTKKHGNGNVQANVRANNSGQFEGTAHENVGFRGKKGQKVHPNFAPNIAMEFHYHAFCTPERCCQGFSLRISWAPSKLQGCELRAREDLDQPSATPPEKGARASHQSPKTYSCLVCLVALLICRSHHSSVN